MKYSITMLMAIAIVISGCSLQTPVSDSGQNQQPPDKQQQPKDNTQPASAPTGSRLDLSGQNLSQVPEYVFGQNNLQELDVSNNKLGGAIQAEIRHLQNLRILRASNNQMTGVPAEIGQLSRLEVLDLSDNQLTGLPYELGNLNNLKTLNISGNNYSEQDLNIIQQNLPDDVNIIK